MQTFLKPEIVEKTISKNRALMQQLHDYMKENNKELLEYLINNNEYEDFLISRTDKAHREHTAAIRGAVPFPTEIRDSILYMGIENSYSEYIESLINEIDTPTIDEFKNSNKYEVALNNMIYSSISIFVKYLNKPYSEIQEKLDKELVQFLEQELSHTFY